MSGFTDGLSSVQVQFQANETTYFAAAAFTILFYDYLLTLDRETSRYWGSRITWATVFFYLNRYGLLVGVIPVMVGSFWEGPNKAKVCPSFATYFQFLCVFSQLIASSISIMRTYALFGRSRLVLGFMLCVTGGLFAFGTWTMLSVGHTPHLAPMRFYPRIGCAYFLLSDSMARVTGVSWVALVLFDCMILSLTIWKAFVSYRERGGRLLSILVRDGALYFLVMAVQHATNIASFVIPGPYAYSRGLITTMEIVLSSVLMNRLMLNLRDPKLSTDQSLVLETLTRPELDISTVEPYYGSAVY